MKPNNLDDAERRYRNNTRLLVVSLVVTVACGACLLYLYLDSRRPYRVLVTLKPGRFGQVVGFTDEETARDFEYLIAGLEFSLEEGLTGRPPLAIIQDFVELTAPCSVELEAGMQARLGPPAEIAQYAYWCRILDGEYEGQTLLVPVLEIDHDDVRHLWPPRASPATDLVTIAMPIRSGQAVRDCVRVGEWPLPEGGFGPGGDPNPPPP